MRPGQMLTVIVANAFVSGICACGDCIKYQSKLVFFFFEILVRTWEHKIFDGATLNSKFQFGATRITNLIPPAT